MQVFSVLLYPIQHQVIAAPSCLLETLTTPYQTLAANGQFRLVSINHQQLNTLAKHKHKSNLSPCGGFINVTTAWNSLSKKQTTSQENVSQFLVKYTQQPRYSLRNETYRIQYPEQVAEVIQKLNPQEMWNNLTALTNFEDRYANSNHGVLAAEWIKNKVLSFARDYHRDDVTVYTVSNSYMQPSVVAKFGNSTEAGVVIGAHMDTLSSFWGRKPGADDDGSGTVTILETARAILSSGIQFKKPLYFIWYAAEEEGLVGSGYVVSDFKNKHIPVHAVIQMDMTGYTYKNKPDLWLIKDYVNNDLTKYLEQLIKTYVKQPVQYTQCGYACSDHASWTQEGFVAAMPSESAYEEMNQSIHTSQDTMEKLSLNHMTDFAKLATSFAVELGEPKN